MPLFRSRRRLAVTRTAIGTLVNDAPARLDVTAHDFLRVVEQTSAPGCRCNCRSPGRQGTVSIHLCGNFLMPTLEGMQLHRGGQKIVGTSDDRSSPIRGTTSAKDR